MESIPVMAAMAVDIGRAIDAPTNGVGLAHPVRQRFVPGHRNGGMK